MAGDYQSNGSRANASDGGHTYGAGKRKERKHGGLSGIRIGEASHPGPAGSKRSARVRRQRAAAEGQGADTPFSVVGDDMGAALLNMVMPLIKKMLMQLIQSSGGALALSLIHI